MPATTVGLMLGACAAAALAALAAIAIKHVLDRRREDREWREFVTAHDLHKTREA
jgi:hypothetical protein